MSWVSNTHNCSIFRVRLEGKGNTITLTAHGRPHNVVEPTNSVDSYDEDEEERYNNYYKDRKHQADQKAHRTAKREAHGRTETKAAITFLGKEITSIFGIQLFKFMSILIPLLPTFALVIYNSIQLEALITRSNLLSESFDQVS